MNYAADGVLQLVIDRAKESARADYAEGQVELWQDRYQEAEAKRDILAKCLCRIARQKRSDELETKGDFTEGYDGCVDEARKALRDMEEM